MFKRKIEKELNKYLLEKNSVIPIIVGARQVGKTFIINKVINELFKNVIEINLKDDFDSENKYFSNIKSTNDLYIYLKSYFPNKLGKYEDTIIFFDEIQVYPHLISLLKPLKKDSKYHYIASGSLLGITLRKTFIPLGSFEEIKMYPLDFEEFLWARGIDENTINILKDSYDNLTPINETLHQVFLDYFKEYLITGGLPDAIKIYLKDKNILSLRKYQKKIYEYYCDDCTQYEKNSISLKIRTIYSLLPSYMENKVKRVRSIDIEPDKRSNINRYVDEFDYLIFSGIVLNSKAVSNPKFPLLFSSTKNLTKLYLNDVGILSALLFNTNIFAILKNNSGINLGSLYETVVAMELIAHGHELFYFDNKKVGEVDFLINDYDNLDILPIEVKSGNDQFNFRAIPKLVNKDGNYKINKGIILGNKNIIKKEKDLITLPIYMIMFI